MAKTGISYGLRLSAPLVDQIALGEGDAPTASCPGSPDDPRAAPGFLCLYEFAGVNRAPGTGGLLLDNPSGTAEEGYKVGATVQLRSATAGEFQSRGTWAVTAP